MENNQPNYMTIEEQAEFLATKWISVGQLEEAGIPCRRGPFVRQEKEKIHDAIQRYKTEHNLSDEQVDDLIFSSDAANGFWSYVARAVPQRGVKSVFYYVRRAHNSLGKAGKWCVAEDEQLRRAVQTHGSDWLAVADQVHRSAADCSDRYRQHVQYNDTKRRGAWSSEEEGRLLHAIEDLAREGRTDMSARGYWVSVSKALDTTRTPKQCQHKWNESLRVKIKNEGKTRCWKEEDTYILICKIASLDVDAETDIEWKSLNDSTWDMWSSRYLQRKWTQVKASYDADGVMCHRDLVHHIVAQTRPICGTAGASALSTPSTT